MTSFNHYALGAVTQWLLDDVAGLALDSPGGGALRVAPQVGHGFTRASVVRRLPDGVARAAWELDGDRLHLSVQVPVGSTARIVLPGTEPETVGHGLHERTVGAPAESAGAAIGTVRDLIDDEEAWRRTCEAVAASGHPAYADDPSGALTKLLTHELDSPVAVVPSAATMYGFIPGLEGVHKALFQVVATLD